MRIYWLCLGILTVVASGPGFAFSGERHLEFLAGMRAKGYYDFALFYLDQMQIKENVTEDIRQVIAYEKAMTLLESARNARNRATQNKLFNQALAYLKEFTTQYPDHPMTGRANTEHARILLGKAQVEIRQSRSPSNKGNRTEFQGRARDLISKARKIFHTAHEQHKAAWESFPRYLDNVEDKDRYQARKKAETAVIGTKIDKARCNYEEAQSYDTKSTEYKKLLIEASAEFETIHNEYRSQVGGKHAQMWQGKCFEAQDEINKALGIYNDLLGHPDRSKTMQNLQNRAQQFRLICLNRDERKDYVLVIKEASKWLEQNQTAWRTSVGLGIRWERVVARERLAESRTLKESDQERLLRHMLKDVKFINRDESEYKDVSTELLVKLSGDVETPKDFDMAFDISRDMIKKIKPKKDAVTDARKQKKPKEEIARLTDDYNHHLSETARYLKLALTLVEEDTDFKDVNQTRYLLAYTHYRARNSYEAAILGEFVATHYNKGDDLQVALDSARLAMAAYEQAYNTSPELEKEIDMKLMSRLCALIAQNWPESDLANDARMQMGRMHKQMKRWNQAAEWYDKVPAAAVQYSQAQVSAGQAYWAAYLNAVIANDDHKPPRDELMTWQSAAEKRLRAGINKMQNEVALTENSPIELTFAKVSLVQIILRQGIYPEAIALLANDSHPVLQAVAAPKGTKRPETGPQSAEFASLTYQLLLRAYIGTQQLDKARDAMRRLENIIDETDSGEAVTATYVRLGQEMEKELKTLKYLGENQRLAEVRMSFENFLNDMFNREEQSYGSLAWIAETYYGLGRGSDDEIQSHIYFEKAASSYQEILDFVRNQSRKIDASRRIRAKLRMVSCRRHQSQFQNAADLVAGILSEKPKVLDAQIEAAYVYQNWGDSGQTGAPKQYLDAIRGGQIGKKKVTYWGWGQIALRLQRIIAAGSEDVKQQYEEKYLDSRYNVSYCRYRYGLVQAGDKKRREELHKAKHEILAFASISDDIGDDWWQKFDTLYRKILLELGESSVALEKPQVVIPAPKLTQTVAKNLRRLNKNTTRTKKTVRRKDASSFSSILFAVLLFGGGGAGIFLMVKNQSKSRRTVYAPAASPRPPQQSSVKSQPWLDKEQGPRTKQAKTRRAQSQRRKPKPPEQQ